MLHGFVNYLLGLLVQFVNPELQAQVDVARGKAAALEAERILLLRQIADGEEINQGLNRIRLANIVERNKLDEAIAQSKAELEKRKADRAALSDAAKLELDV